MSRLRDACACAAGADGRNRSDPRHARPDRDAGAAQHAWRECAERDRAAHLAAARRPARQARRPRATPCRCGRAAEGARHRTCAARNRRPGHCGGAHAADAAAQRARLRDQASATVAGARHAAHRNAHRPAQDGVRGNHVPQVAECARPLFLARRGHGAAGVRRTPRQARTGLDRLRAGSGRRGPDHVRCGSARGTPDLRDRLHPLVAAAGLHRADRRPLRHGARLARGVSAPGADGADRGFRRAATARPVPAHPGWLRAPGVGPHFRHRDGGAGARGSDERARTR